MNTPEEPKPENITPATPEPATLIGKLFKAIGEHRRQHPDTNRRDVRAALRYVTATVRE